MIVAETPACCNYIGMADEAWGSNGQYNNSLVQGHWANGYEWAYVTGGSISNDYVCGAEMQSGYQGHTTFIAQETTPPTSSPPTQNGNTILRAADHAVTSATPTISPASTGFGGSQAWTVTNAQSPNNFNAWCTTDGNTPMIGASDTFYFASGTGGTMTSTTTVKCIGMWGALNQTGNNGNAWPSGYGYAPSDVVSMTTYTTDGRKPSLPVLTGCYQGNQTPYVNALSVGGVETAGRLPLPVRNRHFTSDLFSEAPMPTAARSRHGAARTRARCPWARPRRRDRMAARVLRRGLGA